MQIEQKCKTCKHHGDPGFDTNLGECVNTGPGVPESLVQLGVYRRATVSSPFHLTTPSPVEGLTDKLARGAMFTDPEFGCNQWEERPEELEEDEDDGADWWKPI